MAKQQSSVEASAEADPILQAAEAADAAAAGAEQEQAGGQGAGPAPAAPAGPDYADEARDVIRFALALFVPIYPSLAEVYTKEAREQLAEAAAPVMEKYSVTLGGLKEWPEVRLAVVAVPLAVKTFIAVRTDTDARKSEAAKDVTPQPEPAATAEPQPQAEPINIPMP
jgi:hypothetical protein